MPFVACRHIWLRQPMAVLRRQPDAIVGDTIDESVVRFLERDGDSARPFIARRLRAPRSPSVAFLSTFVSAWRHKTAVAFEIDGIDRRFRLEGDLRMRHALQEYGLVQKFLRVFAAHGRRRHAREGRELVHHASDVAHLADDRVGALPENFGIARDLVAVFALQALGGKLDRRQRILDLMRDASRHVGPGGGALRGDEIGDVVEGDDVAARRPFRCRPARSNCARSPRA